MILEAFLVFLKYFFKGILIAIRNNEHNQTDNLILSSWRKKYSI